ncbi:hypothetical protein VIGAN_05247700 [Vigna angularis var. angularis]|uniref:Peptidase A1 domain-containing protein n=1 Tax=Vigna angularis var. angularis TaxID=157739 RepID=A0A0S3S7P0_PHAAN|nr:hypothetical protein VIGAN_05247700 [Vigna angularis var. angularis]
MVLRVSLFLVLLVLHNSCTVESIFEHLNHNDLNGSSLAAVKFPDHAHFNADSSSTETGCSFSKSEKFESSAATLVSNEGTDGENGEPSVAAGQHKQSVKLNLRHHSESKDAEPKKSVVDSTVRDLKRIQTLWRRVIEKKNQNTISRLEKAQEQSKKFYKPEVAAPAATPEYFSGQLVATLESGVSLGSDPPQPCKAETQSCPYFYWYGDSSNTTGDLAIETFTVNLTTPKGKSELKLVENVMFGCGHWNRGLFHGAAGLLGLGRGPLSFATQLQSLYGHSFSYCLVDRNSNSSVSSKLILGEDKELLSHPNLNFTSFVGGKENPVDTFYYVQIKSIMVGGEVLKIPEDTWHLSAQGGGGTIIDSGTTLTYFAEPAYDTIKEAFMRKIKGYQLVETFPPLKPCYNVSGVQKIELPEFTILFADGAVWDFPVENYFIQIQPEDVVCLAILGTPRSALSIIGNYQQQNFHILYDVQKSRLGYAPMNCADV